MQVLADSLGGAARCLMIACVSPADTQWPETRSTLECATRISITHHGMELLAVVLAYLSI